MMKSNCPICQSNISARDGDLVACASCLNQSALNLVPTFKAGPDADGMDSQVGEATESDVIDSESRCSPRSEQGALRLFTSGYLPRLNSVDELKGQAWTIPSETQRETEYTLRYDPLGSPSVSCSCPGWTYRNYCKHVRFLEFALGLVTSPPAASGQRKLTRAKDRRGAHRTGESRSAASAA